MVWGRPKKHWRRPFLRHGATLDLGRPLRFLSGAFGATGDSKGDLWCQMKGHMAIWGPKGPLEGSRGNFCMVWWLFCDHDGLLPGRTFPTALGTRIPWCKNPGRPSAPKFLQPLVLYTSWEKTGVKTEQVYSTSGCIISNWEFGQDSCVARAGFFTGFLRGPGRRPETLPNESLQTPSSYKTIIVSGKNGAVRHTLSTRNGAARRFAPPPARKLVSEHRLA